MNFSKGNGFIPTSSLREILAALDDQLTNDQLNGKQKYSFLPLISLYFLRRNDCRNWYRFLWHSWFRWWVSKLIFITKKSKKSFSNASEDLKFFRWERERARKLRNYSWSMHEVLARESFELCEAICTWIVSWILDTRLILSLFV